MKKRTRMLVAVLVMLLVTSVLPIGANAEIFNGYVTVPIDSYDSFRNATNGNGG